MNRTLFAVLILCFLVSTASAERRKEVCQYQDDRGELKQVRSIHDVPRKYKDRAGCYVEQPQARNASAESEEERPSRKSPRNKGQAEGTDRLARPEEIELEGNIRVEQIGSPIGTINLRWPRSAETLFGRTPLRAMTDAARTVSRAIKGAAFPSYIQNLNIEWQVVFMDSTLPTSQIPTYLVNNCHPGWMTPPANIYIVAERVAGGCSGGHSKTSVADSQLTEVLVHELGHAVEYYLLKYSAEHDRMRAEGFATWFEIYAASFSSMLNKSALKNRTINMARKSINSSPDVFRFSGSGEDYSRAAMYFLAIEDRLGLDALMSVYQSMVDDRLDFFSAIQKELLWDRKRLEDEVRSLVK